MISNEFHRNPSVKQLRSFSVVTAAGFLLIALIAWRKDSLAVAAIFLFLSILIVLAQFYRPLLRQLYRWWMGLSSVLGWLSSRIILTLIFYLVFTPVALLLKLIGKALLDLHFPNGRNTYWQKRVRSRGDLEKMF